jgi:hypothetical protein
MRSISRSKSSLKISHRNTTSATFEMAHKFQNKLKKSEIFTISTYSIPTSTIYFLTLHQRSQRSLNGMFTILYTCELKGLGEWLLVVEISKG